MISSVQSSCPLSALWSFSLAYGASLRLVRLDQEKSLVGADNVVFCHIESRCRSLGAVAQVEHFVEPVAT